MSNYSKRKGIIFSITISLIIWVSVYFIQNYIKEIQKKEINSNFVLKISQINKVITEK